MCAAPIGDEHLAKALVDVLGDTTWIAVGLAKGIVARMGGASEDDAAAHVHSVGALSRKAARELLLRAEAEGLTSVLEGRKKTGSAENPITKLFPAAITEERFSELLGKLVADASASGRQLTIEDQRNKHSFVDFVIREQA